VGERGDILIIEDDPDVGLLLLDVFASTSNGVTPTLIAHPREMTPALRPSVVVSDLFGPPWYDRMSAVALTAAIRQRYPSARLVLLTAHLEAARDEAEIRADAIVAKPFDVDELLQTVLSLTVPAEDIQTELTPEG
jgi:DNA-binding NtrC family response regulator